MDCSPHTSKFCPWKLVTYLAYSSKAKAMAFERYLKTHSGKALANKRLWRNMRGALVCRPLGGCTKLTQTLCRISLLLRF